MEALSICGRSPGGICLEAVDDDDGTGGSHPSLLLRQRRALIAVKRSEEV
jgi:hypothetical protein